MPKNANGNKLRVVRYKEHLGGKLPVPSNISIIVIGTGARGSSKSVLISTDYYRYLFNCGEGTQRIAVEYKYKLPRLENIFLTTKSWDNIGGLLGAALTLEGNNVPKIYLHGPPQVEKLIRMARTFNHPGNIAITMKDLSEGYHEDNAVRVDYVLLHSDSIQEVHEHVDERMFREEANPSPNLKRVCVENGEDYVVSYIILPFPKPPRLILENCVDLGIPVGPQLSQLKDGKDITLPDGTVVRPDQVLSETEQPKPIIVVECPSVDYLASLSQHEKFASLKHNASKTSLGVELIIHMTSQTVMDHDVYQEWMHSFGPDTQHLILNETASEICHERIYSIQAVLNLLDNNIFPSLPHQKQDNTRNTEDTHYHKAVTNVKYVYRPKEGFNYENCVKINNQESIEEVRNLSGVPAALETLKQNVEQFRQQKSAATIDEPEVVFLGTGASQPSKVRNVSAILVHINQHTSVLLDCGEGTIGQIYRNYGDQADDVLSKIKAVFVSHMHADHHLGTFSVACARHAALLKSGQSPSKLLLLAPVQMTRWLLHYANNIHHIHPLIRLVSLQDLLPSTDESTRLKQQILDNIGLSLLKVVEVAHCLNAFGFVIGGDRGWSITYSGDTMPCDRLVDAGSGCDLLIHEATMEDELEDEARIKTHSTASQAIDVGRRMKAKFTILTHFSQRYAKIPVFDDKFGDNVGVAFDNMRVRLSDLPLLPRFIPVLKVMFQEEHAELMAKTQHYSRKHNNHEMTDVEKQQFYGAVK